MADLDHFRICALALSKFVSPVRFIQIGANDGVSDDPIHDFISRFNWTGICVEPNPLVFEQLVLNRKGLPGVFFDNLAIAEGKGEASLFIGKISGKNTTGQASFSKKQVQKELGNDATIEELRVRTNSLSGILQDHKFSGVDLIQVDTEGYDFEVLKQYDFRLNHPFLLHFEHCHLIPKVRCDCFRFLRSMGYRLTYDGLDTTAVHERFFEFIDSI